MTDERERMRERERLLPYTGYVWATRLGSRSSAVIPEVFCSALWVYKIKVLKVLTRGDEQKIIPHRVWDYNSSSNI